MLVLFLINGDFIVRELKFKEVGFVPLEPPKTLTADDFIAEVKRNGFNPVESTLNEDDKFFYIFCEQDCWLRGEK